MSDERRGDNTSLDDGPDTNPRHDGGPLDIEELLNPDEQRRFRRLCIDTSEEDLTQLASVVELHISQIAASTNPAADKEAAEKIGASLTTLLNADHRLTADERALVRGAVEYFLLADDASDDIDDVLGFDDDARVLNSVLDRIGHGEYRVELS